MSFIRTLYHGKLNPFEMDMPKTKDFKAAAKRTEDAASELREVLSDEQWELYEKHEDARSILEDKEQEEFFVLGFKLGLMLGNEVWKDDRLMERLKEEVCQ